MQAKSSVILLMVLGLSCLLLAQVAEAQEERHSRVGVARYWTAECFQNCYKVYLRCIGKIFPPMAFNNQQLVEMFRDKTNNYHERIEECSAKYHETIHIEDDARRGVEMAKLNATVGLSSNFDLCVFSQCGAGGYYGSFNMNLMTYSAARKVASVPVDPDFDFYFEMNSV